MNNLKKILITLSILSFPISTFAAPTSWDFASGILQPLTSQRTAEVKADHYISTSTTAINFFPRALFTQASSSEFCFVGGSCISTWPSGGGGSGGAHSTSTAWGTTLYVRPNNATDIYALGYDGSGVATSSNEAEYVADPVVKIASYLNGMKLGIGTTSPYAALSVVGETVGTYFTATGTRASTFPYASSTGFSTSYASSTIANIGILFTGLSNGFAYIGSGGKLNSLASSSILLQDLGGAVTDAQVPDSITVTLAGTATALAANGANCSAGSYPLGVDASGAVEDCTVAATGGTSAFEIATTTDIALSQLTYVSKTGGRTTLASVATSTLGVGSSLLSSGTLGYQVGGTNSSLSINTANANTWTAKQDFFGAASSTLFSSNWLKVGGTASTTIDGAGNVALPTAGTLTIPALTSALLQTDANGLLAEYAGTSCTNQFPRSLSALGVATCASVANTDLANSTISGISLGSNLADLTATNGTLTFSGTYNGGTARTIGLNLGNANTWTAASTDFSNYLRIGTTTSAIQYQTVIASSTAPQLSLSAGAGIAQWVQRNAGGNLYFSTTTTAGTATSSVSALSINANGFPTIPSLSNGFAYFNSSGTAVGTTSPLFYERSFTNWASTTPNFNSSIYASGATSTLKLSLPKAIGFTSIIGSIRTGTSLLCEIGNGTASTTRILTTTSGETSDSVTLAGEVTVACGSGIGNPDDANFTTSGTYSI